MGLLDSYAPSARFGAIGARVGGDVVRDAVEIQQRDFDTNDLLFWDDGNPRMQLVVTVDTGNIDPTIEYDDGERAIYIKGQMLSATKAALKKVRAREIKAGGKFWVTLVDEEPLPKGKRGFPKKIYEVEYEPPVAVEEPAGDVMSRARGARGGRGALADEGHQGRLKEAADRAAARRAQDDEPPF